MPQPHSGIPNIVLFCLLNGVCATWAGAAWAQDAASTASGAIRESETPGLRGQLTGSIVTVKPVGGIVAFDLPTLQSREVRPANAGRSAVQSVSEPDGQGRVAFVDGNTADRTYSIRILHDGSEQLLLTGAGDPLWDNAISPVSLAPAGGRLAYVAQPPENANRKFQALIQGPLRLWDSAAQSVRDLPATAAGERPSWFPDGRRLAWVSPAMPGHEPEPVVHVLDTQTGSDTILATGHLPLVSSDGQTVLVTRGRSFELVLVNVATRAEQKIARAHGMGTPIALFDSRYLLYKGRPTAGAATGTTINNSPLVGPKAMLAVKVMDLQTMEFATLIPLIDPRSSVTAMGHAMTAAGK